MGLGLPGVLPGGIPRRRRREGETTHSPALRVWLGPRGPGLVPMVPGWAEGCGFLWDSHCLHSHGFLSLQSKCLGQEDDQGPPWMLWKPETPVSSRYESGRGPGSLPGGGGGLEVRPAGPATSGIHWKTADMMVMSKGSGVWKGPARFPALPLAAV